MITRLNFPPDTRFVFTTYNGKRLQDITYVSYKFHCRPQSEYLQILSCTIIHLFHIIIIHFLYSPLPTLSSPYVYTHYGPCSWLQQTIFNSLLFSSHISSFLFWKPRSLSQISKHFFTIFSHNFLSMRAKHGWRSSAPSQLNMTSHSHDPLRDLSLHCLSIIQTCARGYWQKQWR